MCSYNNSCIVKSWLSWTYLESLLCRRPTSPANSEFFLLSNSTPLKISVFNSWLIFSPTKFLVASKWRVMRSYIYWSFSINLVYISSNLFSLSFNKFSSLCNWFSKCLMCSFSFSICYSKFETSFWLLF